VLEKEGEGIEERGDMEERRKWSGKRCGYWRHSKLWNGPLPDRYEKSEDSYDRVKQEEGGGAEREWWLKETRILKKGHNIREFFRKEAIPY